MPEVLRTVADFRTQSHKTRLQQDLAIFALGARPYQRVFSLLHHTQEMNPEDAFQYALVSLELHSLSFSLTELLMRFVVFCEDCYFIDTLFANSHQIPE